MPNWAAVWAELIAMSASCSAVGSGHDRAVAVGEHPVGQAHQEDAGHRRDAGLGLDDLEGRPHGVRGGVGGTGHHAVDDVVVHQHGPEVGDVVHDLPGLLERDALLLAQLGVLLGELVAQFTRARVEHSRGTQIDAEFGCAGTHLGFITENGQVRDTAAQQSAGRLQDAVVITFGQDDALAVRAGALHQLVGEHLRRGHRGDRDRQPLQHVGDVDVAVHQLQGGVDLALRVRGHPAAGVGDRAGRLESAQIGGDDGQPQAQAGHQAGDLRGAAAGRR